MSVGDRLGTKRAAACAMGWLIACAGCSSTSSGGGGGGDAGLDGAAPDGAATDAAAGRTCVPPAAPDPLAIGGTISAQTTTAFNPAAGAKVELLADADDSALATATTAADGTYKLSAVATGGKPLAAHVRISLTGFATTLAYVVDGLRTSALSTTIYDAPFHDSAAQGAGITWSHANGIVNVVVRTSAGRRSPWCRDP
jgi:hypothetical protein